MRLYAFCYTQKQHMVQQNLVEILNLIVIKFNKNIYRIVRELS